MRRSACVPFPTPGAPTRMIRAALLNSLVAIELEVCYGELSWRTGFALGEGDGVRGASCAVSSVPALYEAQGSSDR